MVISYTRFSTPRQSWGDSLRRQVEQSEKWAKERGLKIDDSLSDRGISAFRGSNTKTGTALGSLLKMAEQNEIPKGSILLVENLDRLSRDEAHKAMGQFLALIESGLKIVTLADGYEYDGKKFEPMQLMMSVMVMARAHEESAIKSHRSKAAWVNKRRNATSKIMSEKMPSWLKVRGGKIVLDEERAAIVRRGFQMAIDGHSKNSICATLSKDGVKLSWSFWHHTFKGRSVLGECQCYYNPTDGEWDREKQPAGDPIKDYYPAVIDEDTWYRANKALGMYRMNRRAGRREGFVNIFGGLLFDAGDRSPMKVQFKRNKVTGWFTRRYVSTMAVEGRAGASKFVGFPLNAFEVGFLALLAKSIAPKKQKDDSSERIEAIMARIEQLDLKAEKIEDSALENDAVDVVVKMLAKISKERSALAGELEELKSRKADGSAADAAASLQYDEKSNTTETRLRTRATLQKMFKRIDVSLDRIGKTVFFCNAVGHLNDGGEYKVNLKCKLVRDQNLCIMSSDSFKTVTLTNYQKTL